MLDVDAVEEHKSECPGVMTLLCLEVVMPRSMLVAPIAIAAACAGADNVTPDELAVWSVSPEPDVIIWPGTVRRSSVRAPMASPSTASACSVWSVFDPNSRLLGEVTVPGRLLLRRVEHDDVVGLWKLENGLSEVRVYALDRRGPV
jgi:hypothetical protein